MGTAAIPPCRLGQARPAGSLEASLSPLAVVSSNKAYKIAAQVAATHVLEPFTSGCRAEILAPPRL